MSQTRPRLGRHALLLAVAMLPRVTVTLKDAAGRSSVASTAVTLKR
jgi:hypothetical protein